MKRKIAILMCSVLALTFVACGNNSTSDSETAEKTNPTTTATDTKSEDTSKSNDDAKSENGLSTIQDFFNGDSDTAQLSFGVYNSEQDAMVSHAVISAIPTSALVEKTQYWLTGDKYTDFKVQTSDPSIQTAGDLAQIDGSVWDAKFSYATENGTTHFSVYCQEDWELAKSASSNKPNYEEGTYGNTEYLTYDGENEGDNSLYTSIKLNGDYYLKIQLDMQKNGVMYEIDNKQALIESIIDTISAE